jgi:hypothetical protein
VSVTFSFLLFLCLKLTLNSTVACSLLSVSFFLFLCCLSPLQSVLADSAAVFKQALRDEQTQRANLQIRFDALSLCMQKCDSLASRGEVCLRELGKQKRERE